MKTLQNFGSGERGGGGMKRSVERCWRREGGWAMRWVREEENAVVVRRGMRGEGDWEWRMRRASAGRYEALVEMDWNGRTSVLFEQGVEIEKTFVCFCNRPCVRQERIHRIDDHRCEL
jgi:hypothetical protein